MSYHVIVQIAFYLFNIRIVGEYLRIVYHIRRDQEGKVVKKVKTRRRDTEERAKMNLLAFLKRELKSK